MCRNPPRNGSMNTIEKNGMNKLILDRATHYYPVSLEEMDQVKLMDRVETKFVFNLDSLPRLLSHMETGYRILEISGTRSHCYHTVYYDTPALELYHLHQRGRLNRYKIRFRKYCDSELSFFEIKFKNNKGRTIKKRISPVQPHDLCESGSHRANHHRHSTYFSQGYGRNHHS